MLATATTIAVWILAGVFCSLYLYPKANTDIQHGLNQIQSTRRCQVQIELWMFSSYLCNHIKLPDSQLPSKALIYFNATIVSMVKDRI